VEIKQNNFFGRASPYSSISKGAEAPASTLALIKKGERENGKVGFKDGNGKILPWASDMLPTEEEIKISKEIHDRAAMDLATWVAKTEDRLFRMFIHNVQLELLKFRRISHYYFVESDLELAQAIKAEGVTIEKCYKHAMLTELRGYYKGVLTVVQPINFETERVM
jgi:hypothetical protein